MRFMVYMVNGEQYTYWMLRSHVDLIDGQISFSIKTINIQLTSQNSTMYQVPGGLKHVSPTSLPFY